jgi:hypothetical protein
MRHWKSATDEIQALLPRFSSFGDLSSPIWNSPDFKTLLHLMSSVLLLTSLGQTAILPIFSTDLLKHIRKTLHSVEFTTKLCNSPCYLHITHSAGALQHFKVRWTRMMQPSS